MPCCPESMARWGLNGELSGAMRMVTEVICSLPVSFRSDVISFRIWNQLITEELPLTRFFS